MFAHKLRHWASGIAPRMWPWQLECSPQSSVTNSCAWSVKKWIRLINWAFRVATKFEWGHNSLSWMRCWAMRRKAHFKNNTQFIDLGDRFICIFPIYFYCDVEMAIGKWSSRPAVLWEIQDRISVVWPIFWQCETALVSLPASTSSLCAIDAPKPKSNWHENC